MITTRSDSLPTMWAYGRASTAKQQITLAAQEHSCRVYFDFRNADGESFRWGGWHPDAAITAKIPFPERPMGEHVLRLAKPGDMIVVSNFDRIFRNVIDCSSTMDMLNERNVKLMMRDLDIRTDTSMGRCLMRIMATFKQFEVEEISRRTREAKQQQTRDHHPTNKSAPVGWKKVGEKKSSRFIPNGIERRWAYRVIKMKDEQGMTFREIAAVFKKERKYYKKGRKSVMGIFCDIRVLYLAGKCEFPKVPRSHLPKLVDLNRYLAAHDGRPPLLEPYAVADGRLHTLPPKPAPKPVSLEPVDP